MPDNIAGYADRAYIKGQYYRYAAAPKPFVYTGDIDTISDELLARAMYVTRGQVSGTLPDGAINNFLIQTIRYGNSTYLQTAYGIQAGYDCYEYRRIYSGAWTDWIGIDSGIAEAKDDAANAISLANRVNQAITGAGGVNSQISTLNGSVSSLNSSIEGVSKSVSSLSGTVNTVNTKTTLIDVSSSYSITKTSGKWTLGETNIRKLGNCIYMSLKFNHRSGDDVPVGSNGFAGTLTCPDSLKPLFVPYLIGFWGGSVIICEVPNDGDLQVRVLASNMTPRASNPVPIYVTGTFMVSG